MNGSMKRWMKKAGATMLAATLLISAGLPGFAAAPSKAFPQNDDWDRHGIAPKYLSWTSSPYGGPGYWVTKEFSKTQMNEMVIEEFETWHKNFYRTYASQGHSDVGYIEGHITGGVKDDWGSDENAVSASEHTGYGMLIYALMAGYDKDGSNDVNCRETFDSLVRLYLQLERPNHLMGWAVPETYWDDFKQTTVYIPDYEDTDGDGNYNEKLWIAPRLPYSASDGDIDIAYALLLADKQWPNGKPSNVSGAQTYKQMALDMINDGIYNDLIHPTTKRVMLGDWHSVGMREGWWTNSKVYIPELTRSSDFMTDNLKAFASVADYGKRSRFTDAVNTCYDIMEDFYDNHNEQTGLMPDFISKVGSDAIAPATQEIYEGLGEGFPAGAHSENACRVPFRLAQDYALSGDNRAEKYLNALGDFISTKNGGTFGPAWGRVRNGYWLDGEYLVYRSEWDGTQQEWDDKYTSKGLGVSDGVEALQFTSCFISSSMVDSPVNLGEGFGYLYGQQAKGNVQEDAYFKDTLSLLNMLLISGNWWSPQQ